MKKKPYDVYSPEIYPRLLFVSTKSYYKKQINMMEEWLLVK